MNRRRSAPSCGRWVGQMHERIDVAPELGPHCVGRYAGTVYRRRLEPPAKDFGAVDLRIYVTNCSPPTGRA